MSVQTQRLVKGMQDARSAVARFGASAAASVGNFRGIFGEAGRAVAGVVKEFYVAPLARGARAIGDVGRSIGGSLSSAMAPVKAFGGLIGETGRAIGGVVGQFYIAPFRRASKFIGGVGKEVGASFAWLGKGMAGPINSAAGAMVTMASAAGRFGMAIGEKAMRAGVAGFNFMGQAVGRTVGGLRTAVGALGSFQAMIVGGGIAMGVRKTAVAAMALAEQTDRARVLFGPKGTADITRQAQVMADAYGTAKSEFIASSAEMGGQLFGEGFKGEDAAAMGAQLTKMAMQMASAVQITNEEAFQRMSSGIAGQSRAVLGWGIDIQETALKIWLLNHGMKAIDGEFTQQQKIMARMAIIQEKVAYTTNNLGLSADSAENATKGLGGRFENLMETLGTALLPVVSEVMMEFQIAIEAVSMAWSSMTAGAVNTQVGVLDGNMQLISSMGFLQRAVGFVADAFQALKIGFYAVQSGITANIAGIVQALSYVGSAIDLIVAKTTGKKLGIGDFLKTYSEDLKVLSAAQAGTAMAEIAKPAASEAVNANFAAAQAKINAMREEAMKPGVDLTAFRPDAMMEKPHKDKGDKEKFASAITAGSSEATNAILRSRYGGGAGKKPEEETARNTGRVVTILERMAGAGMMLGKDPDANAKAIGGLIGGLL